MSLLDTIPDWLRNFRLIVKKNNDILFDSWQDDFRLFKFMNQHGGTVGTKIRLQEKHDESFKIYEIVSFQIYSDMTIHPSDLAREKFGWQIDIVVN